MELFFSQLNILAIIVSIITNMVIGMLWYSPVLFGNIWLKLSGFKASDISSDESKKAMSFSVIPATLLIFSLAIIIVLTDTKTILNGLFIGSFVSLGFIGGSYLNLVFFERRGIKLTLINLGYYFTSLNVASIILILWR